MVQRAQEAEAENPLGIKYFRADMRDLPSLADGSFDLVVAYLTILDVEDHVTALRELARVLTRDGELHFSSVHPCFTPPIASWEPRTPGNIAILDKDKLFKKVDNYFPAREVRFRMWPTAPAETINYHRTISDYAHACRAAGLLIRDIIEPYPPEEVMAQRDYLRENYRAPTMILFQCVKA
jgi:SAM-dependent methyltransferase